MRFPNTALILRMDCVGVVEAGGQFGLLARSRVGYEDGFFSVWADGIDGLADSFRELALNLHLAKAARTSIPEFPGNVEE